MGEHNEDGTVPVPPRLWTKRSCIGPVYEICRASAATGGSRSSTTGGSGRNEYGQVVDCSVGHRSKSAR